MHQDQFLDVIDRDEAERRFRSAIQLCPTCEETIGIDRALGRILSRDVVSAVDVPSFDRSNLDGFAVQARDTFAATEERPQSIQLLRESIPTAVLPVSTVLQGTAMSIATGAMLPRGADAIVMVEHADIDGERLVVRRAVTSGFGVSFAGTDISAGETVLRRGEQLTSRETGVLAAVGRHDVQVWKQPVVAIISTGDGIIPPGDPMRPGMVYDSNSRIIADAVAELGGQPEMMGIVADDIEQLRRRLDEALRQADIVLLSGGTSKGHGDLCYRVVRELDRPGILAHGVALKPGKPICLAAHEQKPVVILPGFPTSAIFTFHEFVAPVVRLLAGRSEQHRAVVKARMAVKFNSQIGRTEYLLTGLVRRSDGQIAAYPMGKGSGSVTAFSRADGFVTIGRHEEIVEAGAEVEVQLISRDHEMADMVVIGSHCVGLDYLLGKLQDAGYRTKFLAVGSMAGLDAATRGECDLAGIHLLDPATGTYNLPFLPKALELIRGYGRLQGIVFRRGDSRFENRSVDDAVKIIKQDPHCVMVNRNQGSGTRVLIDQLLGGFQPSGYAVQARNHNAIAAAVAQERADWGVAIEGVARQNDLGFLPMTHEQYDFVVPIARRDRPAVDAFCGLLDDPQVRAELRSMGFSHPEDAAT